MFILVYHTKVIQGMRAETLDGVPAYSKIKKMFLNILFSFLNFLCRGKKVKNTKSFNCVRFLECAPVVTQGQPGRLTFEGAMVSEYTFLNY